MRQFKLYANESLYLPNGTHMTATQLKNAYPMLKHPKATVIIGGTTLMEVSTLDILRSNYGISDTVNDTEALKQINEIINTPYVPTPNEELEARVAMTEEALNFILMGGE